MPKGKQKDVSIGKFDILATDAFAGAIPMMRPWTRLPYEEVRKAVDIPSHRGARIGGDRFQERATEAIAG